MSSCPPTPEVCADIQADPGKGDGVKRLPRWRGSVDTRGHSWHAFIPGGRTRNTRLALTDTEIRHFIKIKWLFQQESVKF